LQSIPDTLYPVKLFYSRGEKVSFAGESAENVAPNTLKTETTTQLIHAT